MISSRNQVNGRRVRQRSNAQMPQFVGGAGLTFANVRDEAPAQAAAPETHLPGIGRALHLVSDGRSLAELSLLNSAGIPAEQVLPEDALPRISLLNENETSGYGFCKRMKDLKHGVKWGELWSCVEYKRTVDQEHYKATTRKVAIKKLSKVLVDANLKGRGQRTPMEELRNIERDYLLNVLAISGQENPYREMSRMDELGDDKHVLRQIEFLQDDDFIYIVMPQACEKGSLDNHVFSSLNRLSVTQAQEIFRKILKILVYLESKKIHHRDLSPDNFLFLEPNNLVVMDLAMSVRIPVNSETGNRTLIHSIGRCGTKPFMSPEVYNELRLFDGVAADLWSAVHILYCMLTQRFLYLVPDADEDILFAYYVRGGAFSIDAVNARYHEVLGDVFSETGDPSEQRALMAQANTNLVLTPDALTLFSHCFRVKPTERWTLAQVMQSDFFNRPQE